MPAANDPLPLLFTAPERDLIRRSLCMQFSQYPSAAEGILLRTWRGGPCAGQPKVPPAIRTMVERGLMDLRTDGRWPRAHFTEAGWAALRHLAQDRRLLIPCSSGTYARNSGLRWTRTVLAKSGRSTRTNDPASRREHQRINGDGGRPRPARAHHHRPGGGRAARGGDPARIGRP